MTLSDMSYIAFLFRNDMHFLHHHVSGVDFDEMHEVAGDYYSAALELFDYFSERAIEAGESLVNVSHIQDTEIYSAWNVIHNTESVIGWESFCKYIDENGTDLIEALEDTRKAAKGVTNIESKIDEFLDYWKNEILYKNRQRAK
jgi:DNA-binding ferritin-like protein